MMLDWVNFFYISLLLYTHSNI